MFCNVNVCTRAGREHNEDAVFAGDGLLIVMDGASGLNGIHLTSEPTDARWLAQTTVALLAEKLADPQLPINAALTETAGELRQGLRGFGYTGDAADYPSGSVMIARQLGSDVELFSLGDCTALVQFSDGRLTCFHDDAVTRLDTAVLERAQALAGERGYTLAQALPEMRPMLVANRAKRNTPGGYWIFEPSGVGIPHGQRWVFPQAEVRALAMMSDGFYDFAQMRGGPSHQQLMDMLAVTPAEKLVDDLFAALEADSLRELLPRFKPRDDAAVVYAQLK